MRLNHFLHFRKQPGVARRLLAALGPSWASAPLRRAVQSLCLLAFVLLLFYVCKPFDSRDPAGAFAAREAIDAEAFLRLDPLVGATASLAARAWLPAATWAAAVIAACLVIPRGFCGYVCPLGSMIDLFDWGVGKRLKRCHLKRRGWWVHLKYYVLVGVLVAAGLGAVTSGLLAPIPLATRGLAFVVGPIQTGLAHGWHLVPAPTAAHWVAVGLLAAVLGLGLLGGRFWCRCICPSGALLSAASALRLTDRKVKPDCIKCGRCAEVCPFDAIKPDFTTRSADCTFCQSCGGACPVGAIEFGGRRPRSQPGARTGAPTGEISLSRRGFLAAAAAGLGSPLLIRRLAPAAGPVRPPGSVPEAAFLRRCVRCGECINACPTGVLQPAGLGRGLTGLWTPLATANFAGCHPGCNICGQVCPTGAIRALPMSEKLAARMGRAVVNRRTCLPHAGREECQLCLEACALAGYHAIEKRLVRPDLDEDGFPVEDSGFYAPAVLTGKCVGCGLCQARCYRINVVEKGLLDAAAIHVQAGPGKEDRISTGSYRALRSADRRRSRPASRPRGEYLPDFLE